MQSIGHKFLLCIGVLAVAASPAQSIVTEFTLLTEETYASVDASVTLYEFYATIESNLPGGDDLWITFDSYVPDGWAAQGCQTRTDICFTEEAIINVPEGVVDELKFDFTMPAGDVGTGWFNIRIARFENPAAYVEESYAVGHGVTLPESDYTFTVGDHFQQADPSDYVQFTTYLTSGNGFPDSLYCVLQNDLPDGWASQICHEESMICVYEEGLIPLDAYVHDALLVDFLTSADPGIGTLRVRTQSQANPAIWTAQIFRVRTGDIPSAVDDQISAEGLTVRAVPNPLRDRTDLRILLDRPSSVSLRIVDASGRVVTARMTEQLSEGIHNLRWDGTDDHGRALPNGMYFYRIDGDGQHSQGKLTLDR